MEHQATDAHPMQCRLPSELGRLARAEGVDPDAALLVARTDLNLAGSYEAVYLVVEGDRLTTIGAPANGGTAVRVTVAREDIHDIGTRPGVGGGFLEAVIEDAAVEILAYSNRSAPLFQRVAAKLQAWVAGDPLVVGEEDREEPDLCPTCGIRLEAPGEACRRCLSPGSLLGRVLLLMRPYAGRAALMMALVLVSIGVELLPPQLIKTITDRVLAPGQAGNPGAAGGRGDRIARADDRPAARRLPRRRDRAVDPVAAEQRHRHTGHLRPALQAVPSPHAAVGVLLRPLQHRAAHEPRRAGHGAAQGADRAGDQRLRGAAHQGGRGRA